MTQLFNRFCLCCESQEQHEQYELRGRQPIDPSRLSPQQDSALQCGWWWQCMQPLVGASAEASVETVQNYLQTASPTIVTKQPQSNLNKINIEVSDLAQLYSAAQTRDVHIESIIGSGTYGVIYKAFIKVNGAGQCQDVAVKIVKNQRFQVLLGEYKIMKYLSENENRHINVIEPIGVEIASVLQRSYFVMPYTAIGDVKMAMKKKNSYDDDISVAFSEDESRHLFQGIVRGIEHLHSIGIAHCDLKVENILLFQNPEILGIKNVKGIEPYDRYVPKITDFSNSLIAPENYYGIREGPLMTNHLRCAPQYAAPESFYPKTYDARLADMYTLGLALWVMLSGVSPFRPFQWITHVSERNRELMARKHNEKFMVDLCVRFSPSLRDSIIGMTRKNPSQRWTFEQIWHSVWMNPTSKDWTIGAAILERVIRQRSQTM